jgi:hypothetical protein
MLGINEFNFKESFVKINTKPVFIFFIYLFISMNFSFADVNKSFAIVFIDAKTEKELGPFPFDRTFTAKALAKSREYGAKAIIVKYFLDQARPGIGDNEIAKEISKIPVILQAQFDDEEKNPNPIQERFNIISRVQGNTDKLLNGKSGWIPMPKLMKDSKGLGFVDVANSNTSSVPLVLKYQSKIVPSLWLSAIEQKEGKKAKIVLGKYAQIGKIFIPINNAGEANYKLPIKDTIDSLSFIDLINGKIDRKLIAGKIVILGVDLKTMPTFNTLLGEIGSHRLFYHSLLGLLP